MELLVVVVKHMKLPLLEEEVHSTRVVVEMDRHMEEVAEGGMVMEVVVMNKYMEEAAMVREVVVMNIRMEEVVMCSNMERVAEAMVVTANGVH